MGCKCPSCALSHLNFSDENEFGDLIEVEITKPDNSPTRYSIEVMDRGDEGLVGRYITEDPNRLKALRDALTKILDQVQGESNG